MERTAPSIWAVEIMQPYLANVLTKIGTHCKCEPTWQRTIHRLDGLPGSEEQIIAAESYPFYRCKWMDISLGARTIVDKHTASFNSDSIFGHTTLQPGETTGSIELNGAVYVHFEVTRGATWAVTHGDDLFNGVYAVASVYELPNGNSCARLSLTAGQLWLQPKPYSPRFGHTVARHFDKLKLVADQRVFVATSSHHETLADPRNDDQKPWTGLTNQDESGLEWTVRTSDIEFVAGLRPAHWLQRHTAVIDDAKVQTLLPPYAAVWIPTSCSDKFMELELLPR